MKKQRYAIVALGLVLGLCANGGTASAQGHYTLGPTLRDERFMSRAIALAEMEIDGSRSVLRESRDSGMRRYAYTMGREWAYTYSQLKAMALRKGLPTTAPPSAAGRRQLSALYGARGTRVVAAYARDQVGLQREALRIFWDEAKNGDDRYIRNLASVTVPKLRHRLTLAGRVAMR